jgi:4-hydroxy-2-oxoglutarate aldolase
MKLTGIFAAIATPFDREGELYQTKLQHNLEKWNKTALAGYLVGGGSGEGVLLSAEERVRLFTLSAQWAGAGRQVIADATAESVRASVDLARKASDAGCHAVVCGVPHYYRSLMYGENLQALYFRAVADGSPIPLIICNSPQTTGVDISPETAGQLSAHPNIAGVIETGTPAVRVHQIAEYAQAQFPVLAGTSSALLEFLQAGATGAVLPISSAAPYSTIAVWEAFRSREMEAAADWQQRISEPGILVSDLYGVGGLKHAMDLNGYYGGPPRLPLISVDAAGRERIEKAFRDLKG